MSEAKTDEIVLLIAIAVGERIVREGDAEAFAEAGLRWTLDMLEQSAEYHADRLDEHPRHAERLAEVERDYEQAERLLAEVVEP